MALNLNKKVIDQSKLDDLEARIAGYERLIALRKSIAKGGPGAVEDVLKYLNAYRGDISTKREMCYFQITEISPKQAIFHSGQLNAVNFVIDLLSNPKEAVINYQSEMERLQKVHDEWKQLPVRSE